MNEPALDEFAPRIIAGEDRRRDRLASAARHAATNLEVRGVVCVAVTYVDNSGITRMKGVPIGRLDAAAVWGVGVSPVFDVFGADDSITTGRYAGGPVGDLRLHPDLDRLTPLAAQPGWAWAPADRRDQDGRPHPQDGRELVRLQTALLAEHGLTAMMAFEVEWAVSPAGSDEFAPAASGPAYGMIRVAELGDYLRDVVTALTEEGLVVEQIHPEYAAGQFEVSVAAQDPLGAADTCVLVKETVRGVSRRHGLRVSFAPKVLVDNVGNGGHVHLSLWSDDPDRPPAPPRPTASGGGPGGANSGGPYPDGPYPDGPYPGGLARTGGGSARPGRINLMAGGNGPLGLTAAGEAFAAGILGRLPALMALGAPSVASYLRLVPSTWAGVHACWGRENREAALRMIPGPPAAVGQAANLEVKSFDLTANPYLLVAGLLAAGQAGLAAAATLPEPVDVDPASLDPAERARRGIRRLPTSLGEAVAAFEVDEVLHRALGRELHDTVAAVRRAEIDRFAEAAPAAVVAATRWRY
ncbi:glutamine synthetase [Frankia casuarinae]|uniref:L-glutamine synthetase n=1 Tax=Frankia casuarinae (strain DSM 45818 / CECT 9043 / HFP020203 / CcI3) TaxID=106370 RepID=Q2JG90_FRACC|nr:MULTISPECIES: glutamine synthetase family protein [Frankia]ABD09702.1 L-glutamine synthetase [Frankia casuarinae]EYT92945.1 glutamine synthetase [Frankia casuarinae]OFB43170.1 glutamine synthetase [Frankia sp. CgIM4]